MKSLIRHNNEATSPSRTGKSVLRLDRVQPIDIECWVTHLPIDPVSIGATALTRALDGPVCYRTTQRDYNWLK